MRREGRASFALFLLAGAMFAGCLTPEDDATSAGRASPENADANKESVPLMLVHGFAPVPESEPKNDYVGWAVAVDAWRAWGVDGEIVRWGYYAADETIDRDAHDHPASLPDHGHARHFGGAMAHEHGGRHGRNTPIEHIAYHWAWGIYDLYTRQGTCVDAVGHSMGGLIVRYALGAVAKAGEEPFADFPPALCVRRVVTIGTPHAGTLVTTACQPAYFQCEEMAPGSDFLRQVAEDPAFVRPQGEGGTAWLVIGSDAEEAVRPPESAVAMQADLSVMHDAQDHVTHVSKIQPVAAGVTACSWYLCRGDEAPTAHARVREGGGAWDRSDATTWPARRILLFINSEPLRGPG